MRFKITITLAKGATILDDDQETVEVVRYAGTPEHVAKIHAAAIQLDAKSVKVEDERDR